MNNSNNFNNMYNDSYWYANQGNSCYGNSCVNHISQDIYYNSNDGFIPYQTGQDFYQKAPSNYTSLLYDNSLPMSNMPNYYSTQDDSFSIVTESDLYNLQSSTPQSYMSPLQSNTSCTQLNMSPLQLSMSPLQVNISPLPLNISSPPLSLVHDVNYQFIQPIFPELNNFCNQSSYSTHSKKRKVTAVTEKKHICPICNHRSKRKHNLVEHMLTHNPHRPKSFLCSHCSRPFARKYDMKRHEKIHTR